MFDLPFFGIIICKTTSFKPMCLYLEFYNISGTKPTSDPVIGRLLSKNTPINFKLTVQFGSEGRGQNEFISHMD